MYDSRELATFLALPRIIALESIMLVLFLVIDLNKLHVLWLYPVIWFALMQMVVKKVMRSDEEYFRVNTKRGEDTDDS